MPQTSSQLWSFQPAPDGRFSAQAPNGNERPLVLRDLHSARETEVWNKQTWNVQDIGIGLSGKMILAEVARPAVTDSTRTEHQIVALKADQAGAWHEVDAFSGDSLVVSPSGAAVLARNVRNKQAYYVIWDAEIKRGRQRPAPRPIAQTLAISSCGRRIVMSGFSPESLLLDAANGSVIARLPKRAQFSFSMRGDLLACGQHDGDLVLYNGLSGEKVGRLSGHRGGFASLQFSRNGTQLLSGNYDTTAILWDTTPWQSGDSVKLTPEDVEKLWQNLAAQDAAVGWRAAAALARSPYTAFPFLSRRLRRATNKDIAPIEALVRKLDDPDFTVRHKATVGPEELGDEAEPVLRWARIDPSSLETSRRIDVLLAKIEAVPPTPASLRRERVLAMLEAIASPEALALLEDFADGVATARLTQQAGAVLRRLR
jgi:hypothetical protein